MYSYQRTKKVVEQIKVLCYIWEVNVIHTSKTGTTSMWLFNKIDGFSGSVPSHVMITIGLLAWIWYILRGRLRDSACFRRNVTQSSVK